MRLFNTNSGSFTLAWWNWDFLRDRSSKTFSWLYPCELLTYFRREFPFTCSLQFTLAASTRQVSRHWVWRPTICAGCRSNQGGGRKHLREQPAWEGLWSAHFQVQRRSLHRVRVVQRNNQRGKLCKMPGLVRVDRQCMRWLLYSPISLQPTSCLSHSSCSRYLCFLHNSSNDCLFCQLNNFFWSRSFFNDPLNGDS